MPLLGTQTKDRRSIRIVQAYEALVGVSMRIQIEQGKAKLLIDRCGNISLTSKMQA